ncbi:MAG: PfaD family polyunsaturated fatty acid/polyketide biosynthesis protein [Microcoleus sp.]
MPDDNALQFYGSSPVSDKVWQGSLDSVAFDAAEIKAKLLDLDRHCYVVRIKGKIGVTNEGFLVNSDKSGTGEALIELPPIPIQQLGDRNFLDFHGVNYAYMVGAMAGGIAGEDLVITLGKKGILSSFGSGGLEYSRIETAINRIQNALPQGPYGFNLLHSPNDLGIERSTVDLYLKYGIRTVEASAFLDLTPNIVYYRSVGLQLDKTNQIRANNKVIAKLSRREVAEKFLQPAPVKILKELVSQGLITELQATLAEKMPIADDITIEADSGGHTDNRPLVCLLPSILELRDEIQEMYRYSVPVRVGAAGGISTPQAALAAFTMGAAYVVTGSINQSCVEAATSPHTKRLLAGAQMHDVMMAPAGDMFEMGVRVQVLKKGTLFPLRAQKLFEIYKNYDSIESIHRAEREKLEQQIFRKSLDAVWEETAAYLTQKNPQKLDRASKNDKLKMALIFRWYLGQSSRWSNTGEVGREIDYQIWCSPAMGAFNNWVKGSYLAEVSNRSAIDVAYHIMTGAAFLYRLYSLKIQGLCMSPYYSQYLPN